MTLLDTIRAIDEVARLQPTVETVVANDIFRLNAMKDVRYGVFAWLQQQHSVSVTGDLATYRFTFFYADRLTEDKANEAEIQSVGITTLTAIIRDLTEKGVWTSSEVTFTSFNQRFSDECAGVFANVTLNVAQSTICNSKPNCCK